MVYGILLILFLIFLIPKKIFDKFIITYEEYIHQLKSKSATYRARKLIQQVSFLTRKLDLDRKNMPTLVSFKFYDQFIYQILDLSRTHGGPVRDILKDVRIALIAQYRLEVDVQKLRQASYFQMGASAMIIWLFAFFVSSSLDYKLPTHLVLLMAILQVLGIVVEQISVNALKSKRLNPYEGLMQSLYFLNLLHNCGLNHNHCLQQSGIYPALDTLPGKLAYLRESFEFASENWKRYGGGLKEELLALVEELQFALESELDQFKKTCSAVQFLVMAIFFFPGLFLLMGSLLRHFSV